MSNNNLGKQIAESVGLPDWRSPWVVAGHGCVPRCSPTSDMIVQGPSGNARQCERRMEGPQDGRKWGRFFTRCCHRSGSRHWAESRLSRFLAKLAAISQPSDQCREALAAVKLFLKTPGQAGGDVRRAPRFLPPVADPSIRSSPVAALRGPRGAKDRRPNQETGCFTSARILPSVPPTAAPQSIRPAQSGGRRDRRRREFSSPGPPRPRASTWWWRARPRI